FPAGPSRSRSRALFRLGASSDARFTLKFLHLTRTGNDLWRFLRPLNSYRTPLFVLPNPFGNHRGMNVVSPSPDGIVAGFDGLLDNSNLKFTSVGLSAQGLAASLR